MKRLVMFAGLLFAAITMAVAAPIAKIEAKQTEPAITQEPQPIYWYVVSDDQQSPTALRAVRGIVIPTTVEPTFITSETASIIRWTQDDGTTQSFVVDGISSLTFKQGPMEGTLYIPFTSSPNVGASSSDVIELGPDSCCSCASWVNSSDSIEFKQCVSGCEGCGCEGCICNPTYPCPSNGNGMVLQPRYHSQVDFQVSSMPVASKQSITLAPNTVSVSNDRDSTVFSGTRIRSRIETDGRITVSNPESIKLGGRIISQRSTIAHGKALFAWATADTAVIIEQPMSWSPPTRTNDSIDFTFDPSSPTSELPASSSTPSKYLDFAPLMDRCRACGTYPNHWGNLESYSCDPGGTSTCYRCVSWEC